MFDDFLKDYDPFAADALLDFDWLGANPFDMFDHDAAPIQTAAQLQNPLKHERRVAKRQHIVNLKKEALAALITRLPDVDELIYVIGNGDGREGRMGALLEATGFDFGSFIPVLADMLGHSVTCYASTWVLNADHARSFVQMLDDGRLSAMYLLSDPYFRSKPSTAPIANTLINEFARIGSDRARFLSFKNHCKILCMANAENTRFVTVTGSANFTAVARAEQWTLDGSEDTYRFMVDHFFSPMLRIKANG